MLLNRCQEKVRGNISFLVRYKMKMLYKRLNEKEIDIFITIRIAQLREEGAEEDIDLDIGPLIRKGTMF